MAKAFACLRVSGKGQLRGDGFERQRLACQTYARGNDIRIVREFSERAVPGATELDNRPALMELLEALASNSVHVVLIERLDRLARDLLIQETIIGDMAKRGFQVISASEPDLLANDPSRKLMRQIFGAIAEYEKNILVAKLRGARERKRARGERCEGPLPFGRDVHEQEVLGRMRQLRAQGVTLAQVAEQANVEGPRTRFNRRWHTTSVHRPLRRVTLPAK